MTTSHPLKTLVDALRRTVLLGVLFLIPICFSIRMLPVNDFDLWWHLRAGQWIMQHHAFPITDPFSAFGAGKLWVAYSWLFEVIIYGFFARWQLLGVLAFQVLLVLAIAGAIIHMIRKVVPNFTKAAALSGLVLVALQPLFTPRPWLFTILLFVLELDILLTTRTDGRVRRLLWVPLIIAIWANIHIQFVYGLFLLGVATAEQWLAFWKPANNFIGRERYSFTFAMAASVVAAGANPYHFRLYKVALDFARQGGALNYVSEMNAISFRHYADFLVPLIGFGAVAALAWKRHIAPFWIVLLTWAATASFRSVRDLWVLAIVGAAAIATGARSEKDEPYKLARLQWFGVAAVVVFGGILFAQRTGFSRMKLQDKVASTLPANAVEFIKSNRLKGPLYNTYDWGGYLIWALPDEPVSMDGRAGLYGDVRIQHAQKAWFATHEWTGDAELASARLVLLPLDLPLTQILRLDQRYRVAYEDKIAVVFVRENATGVAVSSAQPVKAAGSL